ncbi:glycosyltransferase family 4 protein [Kiritimatiellota bacterium B12222]|nr:glycosyltransferase family 4 protein [Kiritimatiellota bacterium B12222]
MKLAFITPRFLVGGVVGGAETLIRDLAQTCVSAGHEVHLLTTCATNHFTWSNDREPGEETVDGLQVHYFRVNDDRNIETFLRIQNQIDKERPVSREDQQRWADNNVCSRELSDWLRSNGESLDAILVGPYLFGITLESAKIFPERTWLIPCLHDEAFAKLDIVADMFHATKGSLFNSEPEKALAMRLYNLDESCGQVVGMAMEPFEADPDAFAKKHGLSTPYVLYCGRQEGGKNTPLLLDYMHSYIERRQGAVMLVLTGSGDVPVPEKLRPHLFNAGFVSEQEKHDAMAGAVAFIHPSTNESFGIVLLEAWLAKTPAIVHARGEVLRWQCEQAEAGLWFRYYPEFEAMLDRLLEDQNLNQRLGQNGRHYVLNTYGREAIAERLFSVLEKGK